MDLGDLEDLGVTDGQQDAISGSYYTGFGMSVDDFDSLSDEEKNAYESGYLDGFNAGGGWGQKGENMPRPRNKEDLLKAGEEYYAKLIEMADSMSEVEMATEFDFSGDASKKERHWGRDKNLRDVWVHLYEWHRMLLEFVDKNMKAGDKGPFVPFLPEPYTWKTYGDMNVEYWKKHQKTSLEDARKMFEKSHKDVMKLVSELSEEQLFTKGMYPWVGGSVLGSYFVSCLSSHYDWAMKKLKAHKKNCARRWRK